MAELVRLIKGETGPDVKVGCEVLYSTLTSSKSGSKELVDIAISQKNDELSFLPSIGVRQVAIEVKRHVAGTTKIKEDIVALGKVRQSRGDLRTFLIVVSESKRPKTWVSKNGKAEKRQVLKLSNDETKPVKYFVRRVLKAGHSFDKINKAHYCCLIEVVN